MASLFNRNVFLFFVTAFLFSCTEKNNQINTNILKSDTGNNKAINKIGELLFRISYEGHNIISEEELERLLKSNPYSIEISDNDLKPLFEHKGFIKDDELLLSKFRLVEKHKLELGNQAGNRITGSLNHDGYGRYKLFIQNGNQSDSLTIKNSGDLYFKIEDVIPGGVEELIIIVKYYSMNGDNFDVGVYEIK